MTLKERIAGLFRALGIDIEDKLKGFAPRLDVSTRRVGGLYVKQKGRINLIIIPPEAMELVLGRADPKELVSKSPTGKELRGFTRSDLQGYDAVLFTAIYEESHLLDIMEKILPEKDLEALSISLTIRRIEALGKVEAARKLRLRLRRGYGERGNRILNFYATGMMYEFMSVLLALVAFTPTPTDIDRALTVWNMCLEHMEHAVYVNRSMGVQRAVAQVRYRLEVDRANVVLVFGLGPAVVKTVIQVLDELSALEEDRQTSRRKYQVKIEKYDIHGMEAIVGTVTRASG